MTKTHTVCSTNDVTKAVTTISYVIIADSFLCFRQALVTTHEAHVIMKTIIT